MPPPTPSPPSPHPSQALTPRTTPAPERWSPARAPARAAARPGGAARGDARQRRLDRRWIRAFPYPLFCDGVRGPPGRKKWRGSPARGTRPPARRSRGAKAPGTKRLRTRARHARAHARTRRRARAHARTHAFPHARAHSCTHAGTHTSMRTHAVWHACTRPLILCLAPSPSPARMHSDQRTLAATRRMALLPSDRDAAAASQARAAFAPLPPAAADVAWWRGAIAAGRRQAVPVLISPSPSPNMPALSLFVFTRPPLPLHSLRPLPLTTVTHSLPDATSRSRRKRPPQPRRAARDERRPCAGVEAGSRWAVRCGLPLGARHARGPRARASSAPADGEARVRQFHQGPTPCQWYAGPGPGAAGPVGAASPRAELRTAGRRPAAESDHASRRTAPLEQLAEVKVLAWVHFMPSSTRDAETTFVALPCAVQGSSLHCPLWHGLSSGSRIKDLM